MSVDLNSAERVSTDACAGAKEGPWLVTHQGDAWEHHLIEKGDGDQWRVTEVGYGGYARCGQSDKVTLSRGEVTLVHRETSTGIVVECTTPPEMPRVLPSKSSTSSKIAVQLKMRWSFGSFFEKLPSSEVDWRGPRANDHETLSE